jgi:hypothetical protein
MTFRERLRNRVSSLVGRRPALTSPALREVASPELLDLPLRREAVEERRVAEGLTLSPTAGMIDSDDYSFRRLSSGQKFKRRDLAPMQQDRMLEIAWYLWESNPFARRLITAMTDLVVGEGVGFEAEDPKLQEAGDKVWNHYVNKLGERARELTDALSLNGELILPVGLNDVTGIPTIGFIDPYQVDDVETRVDNILVPEFIRLKKQPGEAEGARIKIIAPNPINGRLEGECFYFAINKLPNSVRGRSDFLPLADWLDMFDQYMFSEVERVRLLSAFVWDFEMKDATPEQIATRIAQIGTPQPGSMFGRNQNEKLEAIAPTLNASDRSETARLLTIHIVGSLGMPLSWFGWPDSNRATLEGQNDVAMKTPAARQKQIGGFLNLIVRYGIEQQRAANPVLFKALASEKFAVTMPEIQAKDISRVAAGLGQVITAMDTAMSNRTMSRRVATVIQLALTKHLGSGFDFKADDVMQEADQDAEERQARQDELMAQMAAHAAAAGTPGAPGAPGVKPPFGGKGPIPPGGRKPNPPVGQPGGPKESGADVDDLPFLEVDNATRQALERVSEDLAELAISVRSTPAPTINVHPSPVTINQAPVSVAPAAVTVEAPKVETHVHAPSGKSKRTLEHDADRNSPTFGQIKSITEEPIE